MKVYFEYGHKCNDEYNTHVTRQIVTWKWNWFFVSEAGYCERNKVLQKNEVSVFLS